jgi:hypothetical protein
MAWRQVLQRCSGVRSPKGRKKRGGVRVGSMSGLQAFLAGSGMRGIIGTAGAHAVSTRIDRDLPRRGKFTTAAKSPRPNKAERWQ